MRRNFKEAVGNGVSALLVMVVPVVVLVLNHRVGMRDVEKGLHAELLPGASMTGLLFLLLGGAFVLYFLLKAVSFLLKEAGESRREPLAKS